LSPESHPFHENGASQDGARRLRQSVATTHIWGSQNVLDEPNRFEQLTWRAKGDWGYS